MEKNLSYNKWNINLYGKEEFIVKGVSSNLKEDVLLNHGFVGDDLNVKNLSSGTFLTISKQDKKNRKIFFLNQTHSVDIINFSDLTESNELFRECSADGVLIKKGEGVGIKTADCVPYILYTDDLEFAVLVHAGWRGALRGIINNSLDKIKSKIKDNNVKIRAIIGPSAGICCYEVGQEVLSELENKEELFSLNILEKRTNSRIYFSVPKYVSFILRSLGISSSSINLLEICTICSNNSNNLRYFSHRRDSKNQQEGRNLSFVIL